MPRLLDAFFIFFPSNLPHSSCQLISAFTTLSHPVLLFLLPLGDGVSWLMYEVFSIYSTSHMICLCGSCVVQEKGIYRSPRWNLDSLLQIYKKQFDLIFEMFFAGTQLLLTIYLICMRLQPTTVFQYWLICYNFSVRRLWLDDKKIWKHWHWQMPFFFFFKPIVYNLKRLTLLYHVTKDRCMI